MSNAPYVRAALAQVALDFVPPLIRLSLVDNTEFKEEYGLSAEVDLALGDSRCTDSTFEILRCRSPSSRKSIGH